MINETLKFLKNISVLIVEDDEAARTLIKSGLKPYCKGVQTASDGYEGVEKFSKFGADVILTDIHMPAMNGFSMMQEIARLKPHQKFIVFTSYDTDANLLKSVEAGAALFLKKPIDIENLRTAIITIAAKTDEKLVKITDEININLQKEKIYKNGEEIYLTFLQNKLFWLFAYNLNRLVTYGQIQEFVYDNEPISQGAIQNVVLRVKKELGVKIKNVSETGYMLCN